MAKRTETDITPVPGDVNWLQSYVDRDESTQGMDEYRILPRLKVIQGMTDQVLKEKFGEGTVIIRPGDTQVWAKNQQPFQLVTLFFYTEFAKWADLRDRDNPACLERSYDPNGALAARCRSSDKWFEEYPDQASKKIEADRWKYRYVEHLRFVTMVYGDHPLVGTFVMLSFERGEFFQGRNFISAIRMRKTNVGGKLVQVPLWSQVWQFKPTFRDRGAKKWYGLDFEPAGEPLILPEHAKEMSDHFKGFKELHDKQKLVVDDEQSEQQDSPENSKEF